jgi:hypothetical protein
VRGGVTGQRGRRGRLGEGATSGTRKHTYVWVNVYLRPHQALFLPLSFFASERSLPLPLSPSRPRRIFLHGPLSPFLPHLFHWILLPPSRSAAGRLSFSFSSSIPVALPARSIATASSLVARFLASPAPLLFRLTFSLSLSHSNPPSLLLLLPSLFRVTVPWTKPRERVLLSFFFFLFPPSVFSPVTPPGRRVIFIICYLLRGAYQRPACGPPGKTGK